MCGVASAGKNYKKPGRRHTLSMLPLKLGFSSTPGIPDRLLLRHKWNFVSGGHVEKPTSELRMRASKAMWKDSLGLADKLHTAISYDD